MSANFDGVFLEGNLSRQAYSKGTVDPQSFPDNPLETALLVLICHGSIKNQDSLGNILHHVKGRDLNIGWDCLVKGLV